MLIMLNIVLLLAANAWVAIMRRKEKKDQNETGCSSALVVAIIVLSIVDVLFIGVIVLLACLITTHWYTRTFIVIIGLLTEGFLVGVMTQWLTGRRLLAWCGCAVMAIGGLAGCIRYDQYLKDITLPESFDYRTFTPFTDDSLVQKADDEATLRFDNVETVPRMDGATALYPVYAAFAQAAYPASMAELEPWEIQKIVSCTTTSYAYRKIVDGEADIIFVAGPSEKQEAYAAEKGVELVYTPIGREAFVFFVHPENPIESLSIQEIRSIYAGETTSWDQFGVKDLGNILAFQRDEGSGSQTALKRFVMRDTPLMEPEKETIIDGMGDMVEKVSAYRNHKNAIGYSFRFYCTALMKNFDVKLLAVEGVTPTVENIENETYPLASCFYAVTRSDANENTHQLLNWICGPQGQALVEKCGYTPISATE